MRGFLPRVLIYFLTVFLFAAVPGLCQQQYIIQHYTNENGLPANGIKGVELDKQNGFLWVGTQAGLVRFDGRQFKSFDQAKPNAAASRISVISKNREGTIYCEDDNFAVYRITANRPEFVGIDSFLMDPYLLRGGNFHKRSAHQIARYLRHRPRFAFLPNWMVFHEDSGDSSSFTFIHFGYACHYSAARDTLLYFVNDLNFQQVMKLNGQVYFVRENLDVWTYDDSSMQLLPVAVKNMPSWKENENEKPQFIWKPGMQEPLLVYKQNMWTLQWKDNALYLQPFCSACCPPDARITAVQLWKEKGIIFLGSDVDGLYVARRTFLQSIRSDAATRAGKAEYAQAETSPGVVTTATGLSFSTAGMLLPHKKALPFYPFTMYQNKQGDRWFHSKDTIIHFLKNEGRDIKIAVNDSAIKMVFAETGGRMFVVSDKAIGEITGDHYRLLYKLPITTNTLKNSLNPDDAVEWQPGILAIAAEKLVFFNIQTQAPPEIISIPGLKVKVRALHKFGDYLLIGTYGQGFYMYKNGVLKKMPLDKHGYLSYTHCFMPDRNGFCWISTNHGLFKVSLHALTEAYEHDLREIYYHYFGRADGIYNTELNGGCQPCALRLSNGSFSFPSMNGVVVLDPLKQDASPPGGQVFIDEILADSMSHRFDDSDLQSLPYNIRNLRFRIALPKFGNPENIYFSYKLEPYNSDFETQDIVQNNILQFGGLKPGPYTLYVRVRNGFEPNQFGVNKITFFILKPWYQAWWFSIVVLLALIALIWALVFWRTATINRRKKVLQQQVTAQTKNIEAQSRQLEKQLQQLKKQQIKLEEDNKIKARLIGIISHDMISPIRFMGFLAKKMRDAFAASEQARQTADAFVNVSGELESLSVNMLNWIRFHYDAYTLKPELFDLRDMIDESTSIATALAKEKGIALLNTVPKRTYISQYRQAMGVIVYNLAMNAVKYTESGEIRIHGDAIREGFFITVTDTGIGMPLHLVDMLNSHEPFISGHSTGEVKKFQFGYLIIKDLLQLVQGAMKVESTLKQGTQVTILFKLLPQHAG